MKTSIFNMDFTLPPLVKITEVVKDMPMAPRTGILFYLFTC